MPEPAAALRGRIAAAIRDAACPGDCGKTEEECAKERIQPFVWHHGRLAVVEGEPEMFADAVLAVLPPPADRAAYAQGIRDAIAELERDAFGAIPRLRRLAAEAQPTTQPDEDPARIDRLRPEFFEHASVESIDLQIQRARRQQRHWGNRERTLAILRQARVTQKERGEWPASGARQDGAQP